MTLLLNLTLSNLGDMNLQFKSVGEKTIILLIIRLIEINIALLTELFCHYPPLRDINFNTKCLLAWCDRPVTKCLVRVILGINHPCDFLKS